MKKYMTSFAFDDKSLSLMAYSEDYSGNTFCTAYRSQDGRLITDSESNAPAPLLSDTMDLIRAIASEGLPSPVISKVKLPMWAEVHEEVHAVSFELFRDSLFLKATVDKGSISVKILTGGAGGIWIPCSWDEFDPDGDYETQKQALLRCFSKLSGPSVFLLMTDKVGDYPKGDSRLTCLDCLIFDGVSLHPLAIQERWEFISNALWGIFTDPAIRLASRFSSSDAATMAEFGFDKDMDVGSIQIDRRGFLDVIIASPCVIIHGRVLSINDFGDVQLSLLGENNEDIYSGSIVVEPSQGLSKLDLDSLVRVAIFPDITQNPQLDLIQRGVLLSPKHIKEVAEPTHRDDIFNI